MMPIWERPVEQPWDNRHEWRKCTEYTNDITSLYNYIFNNWSKYSVSGKNEDSYTVIQFFSELQAVVGGTTTLQEHTEISYYVKKDDNKVSHDISHILLRSTGISTDLGLSTTQKVNSVTDFFKPDYDKLDEEKKNNYHPSIDTSSWELTEVKKNTGVKYFQEYLELLRNNTVDEIGKKSGGYLVHLAEGRTGYLRAGSGLGYGIDAYSKKEFDYLKSEIGKMGRYP